MRFSALSHPLFVGEELAPPVAPNTAIPTTIAKGQQPSPHTTTLASLVKGEVLSPEKIRATTGGIVTPPTFPKPHYSSHFPYCNRLYALICFHIGTIHLAFRRGAGLPPLHRILLPSHLSFLFNILITAFFNFAVNYIAGIVSPSPLIFQLEP